MSKSNIEWTGHTWNPIAGCSLKSPGCTHCYAMIMARRIEAMGSLPHYTGLTKVVNGNAVWTGKIAMAPESVLLQPLQRKRPTTYFVNSMSDLFHENVPDEWIDHIFAVMALAPQHTFQVLTKRADRMRKYFKPHCQRRADGLGKAVLELGYKDPLECLCWPLPNVWLGVSCEDQVRADERIPDLLNTPAAIHFISAEPLLGPINLRAVTVRGIIEGDFDIDALGRTDFPILDWVIVGGESGPGARPTHPDWVRSMRDQCSAADVPFFFKQWGTWAPQLGAIDLHEFGETSRRQWVAWDGDHWDYWDRPAWCDDIGEPEDCLVKVGKKVAGRLLDGVQHCCMPGVSA